MNKRTITEEMLVFVGMISTCIVVISALIMAYDYSRLFGNIMLCLVVISLSVFLLSLYVKTIETKERRSTDKYADRYIFYTEKM